MLAKLRLLPGLLCLGASPALLRADAGNLALHKVHCDGIIGPHGLYKSSGRHFLDPEPPAPSVRAVVEFGEKIHLFSQVPKAAGDHHATCSVGFLVVNAWKPNHAQPLLVAEDVVACEQGAVLIRCEGEHWLQLVRISCCEN